MVHHHVKYADIHGVDEVVLMEKGEHKRLHIRLRKEGKCNIPPEELAAISCRSNSRRQAGKIGLCISENNYYRLASYGFAGESIDTAMGRVLDAIEKKK